MKLNGKNYFSREANLEFMSVSQFKAFDKCEASALAELKGEWKRETTPAMLVGSLVDSYFEGTFDTFIDEQADLIRESEAVNHEMWPIDSRHNYPNGDELMDFDSAVERMKQAIDNRIIALDSAINAL